MVLQPSHILAAAGRCAAAIRLNPVQLITAILALATIRRRGDSSGGAALGRPRPDERALTRAVESLHSRLPEIFRKAGVRAKVLELWGAPLTLGGKPTGAERALLQGFLFARDWNEEDAVVMMEHTLRWRREYGLEKLRPDRFPPHFPSDRFAVDCDGRPAVILSFERITPNAFDNVPLFIAWRVCMLEQLMHRLDFGHGEPCYTMVLDCRGFRTCHVSRSARRCAKELSAVLCDHYPDFIDRVLVVSPPRIISLAWSALGPFLPRSFAEAVQVCDESEAARIVAIHLHALPIDQHAAERGELMSFAVVIQDMFGWLALQFRDMLQRATELALCTSDRLSALDLAAANTD